jgi:hypothetical protein
VVAGIYKGKAQRRKNESSSPSESLCFNEPSYFLDLQIICFLYAWGRAGRNTLYLFISEVINDALPRAEFKKTSE